MKTLINLFQKPKILGVVADVNQGKSILLYHIAHTLMQEHIFALYTYGLRVHLPKATQVFSVEELETIQNSIIIIDELSSLFDLENRKQKNIIERSLRLINHNNNIIVLCGVPENFKKFLSAKVDYWIMKKITLADCINGSTLANKLNSYKGDLMGSTVLNISINQALVYDGEHYEVVEVPYYSKYDTKKKNVDILTPK